MADNQTQRNKSAEELALEQQAAIAKLKNEIAQGQADTQKATAQAQSALWQAQKDHFKGPDVAALPGNITSDGTFIESRILARKTQAEAFTGLGEALKTNPVFAGKTAVPLVLYHPADVAALELYLGLMVQFALLDDQYGQANDAAAVALHGPADASTDASADDSVDNASDDSDDGGGGGTSDLRISSSKKRFGLIGGALLSGAAAVAGGPVSGALMAGYAGAAVLRTAIDIAQLFRVDTDYKNFDLGIDETELAAELKKVLPVGWKLYFPAAFPVNLLDVPANASSPFLDAFHAVLAKNKTALSLAAELNARIKELTDAAAAEKNAAKRQHLQQQAAEFGSYLDPLTTLNTAFAQLQGALSTIDPNTKTTPLTQLLQAERLAAVIRKGYVIRLSVTSKGSNKVTKRLWSSAVIRHSAGTELSCVVFAPNGEVVFADTQLKYTPYMKAERITVQ